MAAQPAGQGGDGAELCEALKLARALEAKLTGPLATEALALSELLATLAGRARPSAGAARSAAGPADPAPAQAPAGKELGVAQATSCVVPRGKFDLVLRDGVPHTLCGTAAAQRWHLSMDDVVQLVAVPKGDSVKPMVLVVAQLRQPLATYKNDGTLKSKGSPYLVMQFPGKELQGSPGEFVAAISAAAALKDVCTPSASVFRSTCARPNQPNCALKCFRDVSDGFLYLVKGCILFVPSGGSNLLALCTRWLGSVSFARSPTGRSFSMTVEVDSERADSEKVGELAAADASYTFNEMDIADEASVNDYVKTYIVRPSRKSAAKAAAAAGEGQAGGDTGSGGGDAESEDDSSDDEGDESYDEDAAREERAAAKRKRTQQRQQQRQRQRTGVVDDGEDDDDSDSDESDDSDASDNSDDSDAEDSKDDGEEVTPVEDGSDVDIDDDQSDIELDDGAPVFSPSAVSASAKKDAREKVELVSPPATEPAKPNPGTAATTSKSSVKTEEKQRTLNSFFARRPAAA